MKTLCQLSGGLDSALSTLLAAEKSESFRCVFFQIGQPYASQELEAVHYMSSFLNRIYTGSYQGLIVLDVPICFTTEPDGTPTEYIPVRNLVFAALSANIALAHNMDRVVVGSKTLELRPNDPYCFHDCSKEFYDNMSRVATLAAENKSVEFDMPLIIDGCPLTKAEVIARLLESQVDVRRLWSCYQAGEKYCGKCYHCAEIKKTGYLELFI